jgi:hypothetical protein
MLMLAKLNENIKVNEIELLKLILHKYTNDEKYRSKKIKRIFLYFAKNLLLNPKLKGKIIFIPELIHNQSFMTFLANNINPNESDGDSNLLIDIFSSKIDLKFTLEILLVYLMNMDKNIDVFKETCEKLVNYINTAYNLNSYIYFNNRVLRNIYNTPSSGELIFKKSDEEGVANLTHFIDIENTLLDSPRKLLFFLVFKNYHLIRLAKMFLKVYFEKKYNNLTPVLNLMKEIIQNQLTMYTTGDKATSSNKNADSLTKGEELKDDSVMNKPLLNIRKVNIVLHLSVKKFLIKSLKRCLYMLLEGMGTNLKGNLSNNQMFLEILNYFMSISMVLISCEECWEIKYKGVELLYQVIRKFANIKDTRLDDNSLLIQQYEAQISSCLKIIFTNTFNINSVFKGMKLLYQYISIPITTDSKYLKKANNFIDINIKSNNSPLPSFSEKYDHLLTCKRLNFYCRLYLTGIKNKSFDTISVENSQIYTKEIYYENLPSLDTINEYFINNYEQFFLNIYNMLEDFFIVLTYDRKSARYYKDYHFIQNGDGISFSHEKVMKYSLDYIKVLSLIVNDRKFIDLLKGSYKIDNIICLIFYHINFLAIRRLQPVDTDKISYTVYSDEDVTEELKEKITFNCILTNDLLGALCGLLCSNLVCISKATFFELFKTAINLFTLSLDDIDVKLFNIIDLLLNKFYSQLDTGGDTNGFRPDEMVYISNHVSKVVYYYFTKKLNSLDKEPSEAELFITMKIIDIISANLINMINLKDMFKEDEFDEMFYFNTIIIYSIFRKINNPVMTKHCAAKLFIIFTNLEEINLFNQFYSIHMENLHEIKIFEKFFILFFMILQYLTKKNNENKCAEIIEETLRKIFEFIMTAIKAKQPSEILTFIIKSLGIAATSNFDNIFKNLFENILLEMQNTGLLNIGLIYEEFQNIILTFCLTIEDPERRACLMNLITYQVNNVLIAANMDIMKTALFILKLWSKDLDSISTVLPLLDNNLSASISHLLQIQQNNMAKQNATLAKADSNTVVNNSKTTQQINNSSNNNTEVKNENSSSVVTNTEQRSLPKLKALKFGK